jgi:hypothetical protein
MKRLRWWVIALVGLAALYGTGIDFGRMSSAYATPNAQTTMFTTAALVLPGKRLQANLLFPLIAPLALLAGYAAVRIGER